VVADGLALWPGWQNQQRDLVGMEHLSAAALAPMVAVTLVVFGLLFLLGRLVGHGIRLFDGLLARRLTHAITAAVFVVVAVVVTRDMTDRTRALLEELVRRPGAGQAATRLPDGAANG
jgi:uncharacterized membrane protein